MKELIVGAGVAAALGLYLGNLAQPQLALDAPATMQPAAVTFTDWDDGVPVAAVGRVPDHVLGSDWLAHKPVAPIEPHAAPPPTPDDIEWEYAERAFAEKVAAESAAPPEAPPAPPTYPSVDGDILAGTTGSETLATFETSPEV